MAQVKVKLKNAKELREYMKRLGPNANKALAKSLYREANEIMAESKGGWVPVKTGMLRSSGQVALPEITRKGVIVELGYGNNSVKYATVQHERLDYIHTVGRAKYLEIPAVNHAPNIAKGVTRDLRIALMRASKKKG
jgi:hypothetical protein